MSLMLPIDRLHAGVVALFGIVGMIVAERAGGLVGIGAGVLVCIALRRLGRPRRGDELGRGREEWTRE